MRDTLPSLVPGSAILSARSLLVGYRGGAILPPIDLTAREGEFWAVIGSNGSGKTTMLRTVLGLLPRVAGELEWSADAIVSYVAQRSDYDTGVPGRVRDFVWGSVDRDWSFMHWRGGDRRVIPEALSRARCEPLSELQFTNLSEGQRARVRLARALVSRPNVLVLDEPTSSVDSVSEQAIFDTLVDLSREQGVTLFVVSHRTQVFVGRATHAIFVDRDDRAAITGRFEDVVRAPSFMNRHGRLSEHAYELPTEPDGGGD